MIMKNEIKEKTLVVIPAYNEEKTITEVIKGAKKYGSVLVVDDGSADKTCKLALSEGVIVLKHSENMGKGKTIETARDFIRKYWNVFKQFQAVVVLDADGQHPPENISVLAGGLIE